jgi:type IV secretory pathway VirB2 component (pilin)
VIAGIRIGLCVEVVFERKVSSFVSLRKPFNGALSSPSGQRWLFAQSSSFGQAAQGIAQEMIAIAKWVGIILCIICGIGLMAGGPGTVAKVSGLLLGLIFALFASPIITWVQSL